MPHDHTLITTEYDPPIAEGTGKKYGETYRTHRFTSNSLQSILAGSQHRSTLSCRLLCKYNQISTYHVPYMQSIAHFNAYRYFDYYIPTMEDLKVPNLYAEIF